MFYGLSCPVSVAEEGLISAAPAQFCPERLFWCRYKLGREGKCCDQMPAAAF